jgi:hypothetical protein
MIIPPPSTYLQYFGLQFSKRVARKNIGKIGEVLVLIISRESDKYAILRIVRLSGSHFFFTSESKTLLLWNQRIFEEGEAKKRFPNSARTWL